MIKKPPSESKAPPVMSLKETKMKFPNYFPPRLSVTIFSDEDSMQIFLYQMEACLSRGNFKKF